MIKQNLRAKILKKRKGQNPDLKNKNDSKIQNKIIHNSFFKKAKNILFYMPIHGEPDTLPLIERSLIESKNIYLPRVDEKNHQLHLHRADDINKLIEGNFTVKEPHHESPSENPEKMDLVLVPGIVFSKTGQRIGYGKGYFDRLLKKTHCPKIALAYDFQIVENIPAEPHDVPVDTIITESKTIKIPNKFKHAKSTAD